MQTSEIVNKCGFCKKSYYGEAILRAELCDLWLHAHHLIEYSVLLLVISDQ